MPEITIENSTHERLWRLAQRFFTEDMVINRVLNELEDENVININNLSELPCAKVIDIIVCSLNELAHRSNQGHQIPPDVIDQVLNALETLEGLARSFNPTELKNDQNLIEIDPQNIPDPTHTKFLNASLAGEQVPNPNWALLIDKMLIHAVNIDLDFDEIEDVPELKLVQGNERNHYVTEIDKSYNGLNAKDACKVLVSIAQRLEIELDITWMWRDKPNAAHPGRTARLHISGKK